MAAGRFSVSRRKDLHDYSKKEYDCYKKGLRGHEFSKDRDRDVGKRNGYHKYSSNARKLGISGDGHQRGGIYVRTKDREPVQLSNGSENWKAFAFHTCDEDGEIENGVQLPPEKKRKFSPIVWDIEEKDVKGLSKHRIVPTGPSPSPSSSLKSDSVIDLDGIFRTVSPTADQPHGKELSLVEPHAASGSAESTITECSAACSSLSQGRCGDENLEEEQLEEAEFVGARNISMSRWASESDSPADIGISDDEDIPKRNKMARNGDVSELLLNTQFSSPECGEFLREDSEGDRARSYGTDGGGLVSPASGEKYSDDDLYRNDDMEIGEDNTSAVASELDSDSDSEDDNDCSKNQEPRVPNRRVDMLQSCRCVFDYEKLNKINEGTYGVVYRARDKQTGEIVALKKVKMGIERDGFPLSSLREINILSSFHHPSIVNVKEVVMGDLDSVFMVMEYMEHDLKGLMEVMKQPFSISEVKCLMLQLLEGVKYLHDNWVLHRDLKSSNLLVNNRGELKICDFGLSRQYGSPLKPYTPLVVTLWYRAPELLLGTKKYSTAIDMWSVGCIMAELLSKEPLFKGKSEVDQLDKIFRTLGTPNETIWSGFSELPGAKANFVKQRYNLLRKKFPAASFTGFPTLSESGFDLLSKLLTYDPEKRITVEAALNHEWFCEVPLPKSKEFMPTFPAQNAQDRYRHK